MTTIRQLQSLNSQHYISDRIIITITKSFFLVVGVHSVLRVILVFEDQGFSNIVFSGFGGAQICVSWLH